MKTDRKDKIAFISTLLVGLLSHCYALANKITNHDDMSNIIGISNGFTNGRWMWSFWSDLNLVNSPLVYGMINVALIAICAVILVRILQLKHHWSIVLTGGLFATSPANTTLYFYASCIPSYSIGVLFAVLAAYCFSLSNSRKILYLCGILCVAFSLGSYQAYLSITAAILILILIQDACIGNISVRKLIVKCFSALFMLIFGLLIYWLITQGVLAYHNIHMTSYQGLDSMTIPSISALMDGSLKAYSNLFKFNATIDPRKFTQMVDCVLPVLFFLFVTLFVIRLVIRKEFLRAFGLAVLGLLYPIACNVVYLYGADQVYALMQYGYVFLPISLLVFVEMASEDMLSNNKFELGIRVGVCAVLLLVAIYDGNLANEELYLQQKTQEFAFKYMGGVGTRIEAMEDYSPDTPIALIGWCSDPRIKEFDTMLHRAHLGGNTSAEQFVNSIIFQDWLRPGASMYWTGYMGNFLPQEQSREIFKNPVVQEMPDYPADGSIAEIDGVIVVHFSSNF